jgi:hypothetical protein
MRLRGRIVPVVLLIALTSLTAVPAFAQARTGSFTLRFTALSPIVALLAGILILIFPRLLNFIVALYLIIVGLIGLFGL